MVTRFMINNEADHLFGVRKQPDRFIFLLIVSAQGEEQFLWHSERSKKTKWYPALNT